MRTAGKLHLFHEKETIRGNMKKLEIKGDNNLRISVRHVKNLPKDSRSGTVVDKYDNFLVAELSEKRVEVFLGEFKIVLTAAQAQELAGRLVLVGFNA